LKKVDGEQIERFLASAERKLAAAHQILTMDQEACPPRRHCRKQSPIFRLK
jgi:hypothetical protein